MEAAKGILVVLATVFVAADCLFPFSKRELFGQIGTSQPGCVERLRPCWVLLSSQTITTQTDPGTIADNVDQLCIAHQQAADCLRPLLDECVNSSRGYINAFLYGGDYMCSEGARARNANNIMDTTEKRMRWREKLEVDNNNYWACHEENKVENFVTTDKFDEEKADGRRKVLAEARNSTCYSDRDRYHAVYQLANICISSTPISSIPDSQENSDYSVCQVVQRRTQCVSQAATQQCGVAVGTFVRERMNAVAAALNLQC